MAGGYWIGQCRSGTSLSLWEVLLGSANLWAPSFLCLVFSGLTVMYLGVFITFIWLQVHWTWICKLIASPKFRKVFFFFFFNYFFSFFFSPSISLPFLQNSTSKVAQVVKNLPVCAGAVEMWVWSLGRRIPWRRARVWMAEIVYFSGWCWGTRWKLGVLLSLSSVQPLEGPTCEPRQKERGGNSQWLSHLASTAGGPGLIPAQKTKFLHARRGGWRKQQQNKLSKKEKQ